MNAQRRKIIISEIKYWRQHKLLPEHYCDFLITLYAQGEQGVEEEKETTDPIFVKERKRKHRAATSLILLALGVVALLLLFTSYPMIPAVIGLLAIGFFIAIPTFKMVKHPEIIPLYYVCAAFIMLSLSFKLWFMYFPEHPLLLIGLLALNCLLWLYAGRMLRQLYFTISGALGLLLIIGFMFYSA